MEKKVSPHVTCPASPQTLSMGRFFVFTRFLQPWPKNAPKPMEKQKNKKQKKSAHTALAVKACLLGGKTATLNAQSHLLI
jgi:hypothetical protein